MMFIDAAQKILINFLKSINLVGQLSSRGGMLINQQLVLYWGNNETRPQNRSGFQVQAYFWIWVSVTTGSFGQYPDPTEAAQVVRFPQDSTSIGIITWRFAVSYTTLKSHSMK